MYLYLPDVTLVIVDTVCHELATLSIEECERNTVFGDTKIFSDKDLGDRTIRIKPFTKESEVLRFINYKMPTYIKTSHVLMVQWDSWIIDTGMWSSEYLKYDYVGAPWWYTDGFNVGNAGFCLRSKALLDFMAANEEIYPVWAPEDGLLCREYRKKLPQFKWAPEDVASRFSFERSRPSIESRHFGFHGMFNWPFVLPPDKLSERMLIARNNLYIQKTGMLAEIDGLFAARWRQLKTEV